jgi:mannosyltransferase
MTQAPIFKSQSRNPLAGIHHWSLTICLLFAFALRIYRLDAQSIWVDEGISLHLATSSLAEIVANRAANIHPPLYFFLLKGWVALTGVNIYSARLLSAMASLLQVAVIYAVVRRWMGRPTARIAALLTALSPLSVIYAQETRTYALLPLIYLALLAITHELIHNRPTSNRPVAWLLLGIVEIIGLYLHYTTVFLVAYAGTWAVLILWKERRWNDLGRWTATQLLAGLACLPWLVAVLTHWSGVQAELEKGWGLTDPVPLDYLLSQVWVFHLTGLAGAVGLSIIRLSAGLVLLLLVILLLVRFYLPSSRRTVTRLAAHWLIPVSAALLAWTVRTFSHPRYLTLYAPGLILLAAYAIHPSDPASGNRACPRTGRHIPRLVLDASRIALAISLLLSSLLGLRAYFFDPTFAKDDVRGVARHLEKTSGPDDLILIPESDWSLTFTYRGESSIEMPHLRDEDQLWADLAHWTAQSQRVSVMDYRREIWDWGNMVFFALEEAGTKVARYSFKGLSVQTYRLDHPIQPPTLLPVDADFGPLTLTEGWVEAQADAALTLALRWRLEQATDQRYALAIRLLDVDGWPLTTRDDMLLDAQVRPTDYWEKGQETTTYHVLPIPPAIPPLDYTLSLGLYEQGVSGARPLDLLDSQGAPQGQWLDVANVRLTVPVGLVNDPYGATIDPPPLPQPADLADGLQLLGADLDRLTLGPGQSLFVTLHWRATRSSLPDLRPRLTLVQDSQELSTVESAPALGRYPTNLWQAGETVIEHRRLVAPSTAAGGPADVILTVEDQQVTLGRVEIDAQGHTFAPPAIAYPLDVQLGQVARLIGYDLPSQALREASASEPIPLTLYWQALEGAADTSYTVFTHILAADGHLIGGHDSPPAEGARPTLGWLPGEIVIDQHTMAFREPYTGPARIEVGLYDPSTMERVPVEGGETFVLLPTILTIGD